MATSNGRTAAPEPTADQPSRRPAGRQGSPPWLLDFVCASNKERELLRCAKTACGAITGDYSRECQGTN